MKNNKKYVRKYTRFEYIETLTKIIDDNFKWNIIKYFLKTILLHCDDKRYIYVNTIKMSDGIFNFFLCEEDAHKADKCSNYEIEQVSVGFNLNEIKRNSTLYFGINGTGNGDPYTLFIDLPTKATSYTEKNTWYLETGGNLSMIIKKIKTIDPVLLYKKFSKLDKWVNEIPMIFMDTYLELFEKMKIHFNEDIIAYINLFLVKLYDIDKSKKIFRTDKIF